MRDPGVGRAARRRDQDVRSPDRDKTISRGISRDMSPKAVGRRLDTVSGLRALTQSLGTARKTAENANGEARQSDAPEHSAAADNR
jgi:hypothetical protein